MPRSLTARQRRAALILIVAVGALAGVAAESVGVWPALLLALAAGLLGGAVLRRAARRGRL